MILSITAGQFTSNNYFSIIVTAKMKFHFLLYDWYKLKIKIELGLTFSLNFLFLTLFSPNSTIFIHKELDIWHQWWYITLGRTNKSNIEVKTTQIFFYETFLIRLYFYNMFSANFFEELKWLSYGCTSWRASPAY